MQTSNRELFSVVVPFPKHKNQIVSLNNTSKWYRYSHTKIKNEYKGLLKEWFINRNNEDPFEAIEVGFSILRHNSRKFDSDNGAWAYKWIIDTINEQGWIIDDNQVFYSVEPSVVVSGCNETLLKVVVRTKDLNQRIT